MRTLHAVALCALSAVPTILFTTGCQTTPRTRAQRDELMDAVRDTIAMFNERDPTMRELFADSYGYTIFPSIAKGAVGVGGGYGRGAVFRQGEFMGWADVTQGSIGLQLGGQAFRQVIFFENERVFNDFLDDRFTFTANASAVAADAGAAAAANFVDGTLVFTMTRGGLMYEASIGGQNFDFEAATDDALTRR